MSKKFFSFHSCEGIKRDVCFIFHTLFLSMSIIFRMKWTFFSPFMLSTVKDGRSEVHKMSVCIDEGSTFKRQAGREQKEFLQCLIYYRSMGAMKLIYWKISPSSYETLSERERANDKLHWEGVGVYENMRVCVFMIIMRHTHIWILCKSLIWMLRQMKRAQFFLPLFLSLSRLGSMNEMSYYASHE